MVGRSKEIKELNRLYESDESEFIAVYGRRRVGKTYLVRETFADRFVFYHTGLPNATKRQQLAHFKESLSEVGFVVALAVLTVLMMLVLSHGWDKRHAE